MEWRQILDELTDAVEVRNGHVAALRNASTHVTELTAQAIAAGAPHPSLTRVLADLQPVIVQQQLSRRGQDTKAPPQPEPAAPTPLAHPGADSCPLIVRRLLEAFTAHGDPEWLTLSKIADHLVSADPTTWGQWEGRHNRLLMIGRTLRAALRRDRLQIPVVRLSATIDRKRPAVYQLADIQRVL
ncbi:hypothetical protein [Streptomyces sp. NPDC018031]|uniref:hypothetical protein n=1 Tax=Streptomyces sp. NPDC018031 TaxID=3365033 RepID=UPI00378BE540